jgi:hypothetical protein
MTIIDGWGWKRFRRERLIRWLMREYGLTRSEAEAYLRQSEAKSNYTPSGRVVLENIEEDDPSPLIPEWVYWALAGLAFGYIGLSLLDWFFNRRKKHRRKREGEEWSEWLV